MSSHDADLSRNRLAHLLAEPTAEQLARMREREIENKREDERRERERRFRLFRDFIDGRRAYADCTLDSWKFSDDSKVSARQRVVVDAVGEFCRAIDEHRRSGTGVIFYGPVGVGKDHFATIVVRAACINHGHTAKYVNGASWFGRLRDSMDGGESEAAIVRELVQADWIVLSDPTPQAGQLTPYQSASLYRVVDERSARRLPTITTLNVSGGTEAVERLGVATWDRLKGGAWCIPCNWPSRRVPARIV